MQQQAIYFSGCDLASAGRVRLGGYLRKMQEIACLDLKNFHLSPEILYQHGIAFILSKTSLRIEKTFLESGEADLLTYPRQSRGASFMRDFVFTQNEKVIAKATTRWGILNLKTRTLCRPSELPFPIQGEENLWVGFEPPRLSPSVPEDAIELSTQTVPPCMSDANMHLNNAAYLDLCLNVTGDAVFTSLDIEYRHELSVGDIVRIYKATQDESTYTLYGVRESDQALSFLAQFQTEKAL